MAYSDSWPAWAGVGVRRTRLLTYSLLVAAIILGAYTLLQWESIPSLDQWKSRYCDYNATPLPSPNAPLADHSGAKPTPSRIVVTVTATVEKTVRETVTAAATAAPKSSGDYSASKAAGHNKACVDPYRRPGYLWIDNSTGDYDTTRWIPFTPQFVDAEDPEVAAYPYNATENGDIWFDEHSKPSAAYLDDALTPTNWLALALEESRRIKEGEPTDGTLSWLYGRVVVIISDSVDRYNTQWFCAEFRGREYDDKAFYNEFGKIRVSAMCSVPSLNFTIIHWHLTGMVPYNPTWWWDPPTTDQVPFEERYDKLWSQTYKNAIGKNGKGPDLIMWQSSVWDRNNLGSFAKYHYGADHPMGNTVRHLVWDELLFYAARAKTLIRLLKDKLGSDVPMILRTVTLDAKEFAKNNMPYDLDRVNRAICEQYGIEPFEWGRLIAGNPALYRDAMHPGRGPASWLWGTMLLEYLARAVGAGTAGGAHEGRAPYFDGWDVCHEELTHAGTGAYN